MLSVLIHKDKTSTVYCRNVENLLKPVVPAASINSHLNPRQLCTYTVKHQHRCRCGSQTIKVAPFTTTRAALCDVSASDDWSGHTQAQHSSLQQVQATWISLLHWLASNRDTDRDIWTVFSLFHIGRKSSR